MTSRRGHRVPSARTHDALCVFGDMDAVRTRNDAISVSSTAMRKTGASTEILQAAQRPGASSSVSRQRGVRIVRVPGLHNTRRRRRRLHGDLKRGYDQVMGCSTHGGVIVGLTPVFGWGCPISSSAQRPEASSSRISAASTAGTLATNVVRLPYPSCSTADPRSNRQIALALRPGPRRFGPPTRAPAASFRATPAL
jgi:hypothetical protein